MKILFDKQSVPIILTAINKDVDPEGYIVERGTKNRVLTPDGEKVHIDEFAGVIPGSEIFLKDDAISLLRYYDRSHATTS